MAVPFSNTKLRVPRGFQNILEGLVREVLRDQPKEVYKYGADYFAKLLKAREDGGEDPAEVGSSFEDRFYNNKDFARDQQQQQQPNEQTAPVEDGLKSNAEPEEASDETAELEQAAVRIQAGFRGYQVRRTKREEPVKFVQSQLITKQEPMVLEQREAVYRTAADPEMEMTSCCAPTASMMDDSMDVEEELQDLSVLDTSFLHSKEEEDAAVRIQAGFRGYKTRSGLKKVKDNDTEAQAAKEEIDIDLTDPEVEQAAVKIQAGFKGLKARKEAQRKKDERSGGATPVAIAVEKVAETAEMDEKISGMGEMTTCAAEEEEIDIDLDDPEVAKAAEKIQAGFKGFKARKDLEARAASSKNSNKTHDGDEPAINEEDNGEEEEIDIDLDDPDVAKAAEKIQAGFKGFKVRKDMEARAASKSKTPTSVEPITEEGTATGADAATTDAAPTDAASADTAPADSAPADSASTDAAPADAAPADAAPAEAAPTDAAPADPAPADAAPADAAPTDAAPRAAEVDSTEKPTDSQTDEVDGPVAEPVTTTAEEPEKEPSATEVEKKEEPASES